MVQMIKSKHHSTKFKFTANDTTTEWESGKNNGNNVKQSQAIMLDDWVTDAQTVARMSEVLSEVEIKRMKTSDEMASN